MGYGNVGGWPKSLKAVTKGQGGLPVGPKTSGATFGSDGPSGCKNGHMAFRLLSFGDVPVASVDKIQLPS